jgi:hypothetical protein
MFAAVTLVTVPVFFAALAARPDFTPGDPVPGLPEQRPGGQTAEIGGADRGTGSEVEFPIEPPLRLRAESRVSGDRVLVVEAPEAVEGAGLLLYWLPSGAEFPERAVLLGPVRGHGRQVLPLPRFAVGPGVLVLYDLGHSEEVARVEWPGDSEP